MTMFWAFKQMRRFDENTRGANLLDTGAHFYDVYRCADGEYVSIGSIEPQFYAELLRLAGLEVTTSSPRRWTPRGGPISRRGSRNCSHARPGPSGARSWR
jgi:alpha-methylacyl-CoA racemase